MDPDAQTLLARFGTLSADSRRAMYTARRHDLEDAC